MAAFDHVRDLYDFALKPRLLRSLVKEQLPDETRAFRNPSELSSIVAIVKTHEILFESTPDSADPKNLSSWKSAVDSWVDRILLLTRSNLPDKCWVGVCLLGVTITECSSQRFVDSYSDWFNALVSHIQPSGASQLVKVASCAAVSDLLKRLGTYSNLKKDGNALAGRLVQPILKILNEEASESMLEVAAPLLSNIITHFPPSCLRYYDNVEGAIVSKIMFGNSNADSLKKLASCLALLPKSKGDEESWSLMMQKILLCLSSLLNDALEGLEEELKRDEAVILLVPPGKDPPPSLGGQALNKGERSHQWLISTISSLMNCCCTMLTSSYPVQVAVPVRPLLAIVRRVLMVNGSLPESLRPFTTAMQQEFVCLQLPALQHWSLEVLAAVVKGIRCQLLPDAADLVRILTGYFKKCWLSELRTKVYTIIKDLLILMGAGMALYISQEIITNAFIDLKFAILGIDGACNEESPIVATLQRQPKKRKHGTASGVPVEQHASTGSEVKASKETPSSIALKIAAVESLEVLLAVGGALRSESWRRKIDHLLIQVATKACRVGWTHDEKPFLHKEAKATWEDFQLVALHALLASLLSPAGTRPPYLAQGLELFRKGKLGTGTKVAEFCAQALLALEVLIHPRALPFIDISLGRSDFGAQNYKSPFSDPKFRSGSYGKSHDVYDFLNDIYLENNSVSEVQPSETNKRVHFNEKLAEISKDQNLEKTSVVNLPSDTMTPSGRDDGQTSGNQGDGEIVMQDVENHHGADKTIQRPDLSVSPESSPQDSSSQEAEAVHGKDSSDAKATDFVKRASESGRTVNDSEEIVASTLGDDSKVGPREGGRMFKVSAPDEDDDELSDPFPDIVDADPDSDSSSE